MKRIIKKDQAQREVSQIYDFSFDKALGRESTDEDYDFPHFHWQKEYSQETASKATKKVFQRLDFTPLLDESTYGRRPEETPPQEAFVFPFMNERVSGEIKDMLDREQVLRIVAAEGNAIKVVAEAPRASAPPKVDQPAAETVSAEASVSREELRQLEQRKGELEQQIATLSAQLTGIEGQLQQSQQQLEQSQAQARQVLEEARAQEESIREEARSKGEADARQELIAIESQKLDGVKKQYEESVARVGEAAKKFEKAYLEAEQNLIDLAIHIATSVINSELKTNHLVIVGQVKKAIVELINREEAVVKVSAADYDALQSSRPDVMQSIPSLKVLTIEKDESLPAGSCVVENEYGSVHANVQSSLREIEQTLKG